MSVKCSTGYAGLILGPNAWDAIFQDGAILCYSGPQPDSADLAPTGTLLGKITRNGGAWTPGSPTNGLRFIRTGRYVLKDPGHNWKFEGEAAGVVGWCRLVANAADAGADSLILPRIDGAVGLEDAVGDYQLRMVALEVTASTSVEISNFIFALPPLGA